MLYLSSKNLLYNVLRNGTSAAQLLTRCQCPRLRGQFHGSNIYAVKFTRQTITQTSTNLEQPHGEEPEFKIIYRLPYIRHVRLLSRLKLAQTIFVVGIIPPLGILRYMDLITDTDVIFPVGIATFALVMLYFMSFYLRRIIGIMYINQEGTKLKVGHLNFWGHRQDFVVAVEDILSNLETGDSKEMLLRKFETFDSKKHLYFTLKYGHIIDKHIFYQIFGEPR